MELENIVANTVLLKAREGKWPRDAEMMRVCLCCIVGGEGGGMVGLRCSVQQVTHPIPGSHTYTHRRNSQLCVCVYEPYFCERKKERESRGGPTQLESCIRL